MGLLPGPAPRRLRRPGGAMTLLVRGGTVVSPSGSQPMDVLVDGERIVALVAPGDTSLGVDLAAAADTVIDATGKYVVPGGIDCHTHMELPFGGTFASDTFETGTRAAAWGGTTTIVDFAVQRTGERVQDGLAAWHAKAAGTVRHRLRVPPDHRRGRRRVAEGDGRAGRRGHHELQAVHGLPRGLLQRRRADPACHADRGRQRRDDHDARRERHRDRRPRAAGAGPRRDLADQPRARPGRGRPRPRPRIARSCWPGSPARRSTSCTCPPSRRSGTLAAARDDGLNVFGETCPQYLYLSLEEQLGAPGFEGAKWVCSTPLRARAEHHQDELWKYLRTDDLSVVSTDHCPFCFKEQKELGVGDFSKIPNGIGSVEHRMDLLYQGVVDGRITLERWVELCCTTPGADVRAVRPQGRHRPRRRRGPRRLRPRWAYPRSRSRPTTWPWTTRRGRATRSPGTSTR